MAEKAARLREADLMDKFQNMQDSMTQALKEQGDQQAKNAEQQALSADKRQADMLRMLIPQLLQAQPGSGIKTAANNLGSTSHTIPSTGIIAAAASGYDPQSSPLAHLVGELSSGITANNQGKRIIQSSVS
jgi:hypothetical protein